MVTVLLIAATLTAVASAAAFTTIREFRSSTQDRRSARALAFAEAGIDRLLNYMKTGRIAWSDIALAGCPAAGRYTGEEDHPPLTLPTGAGGRVGDGSYTVHLEVFNPITTDPTKRFAPGACADDGNGYPRYWASPRLPPEWWSGTSQYFAIVSTGASATSATPCPQLSGGACRTVHQVVRIRGVGLPVGIYAKTSADLRGNPSMENISLLTPGSVTGRSKAGFSGLDPYYFVGDLTDWASMPLTTRQKQVPAAVHAGGSIALGGLIGSNLEHPTTTLLGGTTYLNCTANNTGGTAPQGTPGQSQWDQSGPGYGGVITGSCTWTPPVGGPPNSPPPTSVISDVRTLAPQPDLTPEDYAALKTSAQSDGIWCSFSGATTTCTRKGVSWPGYNGTVNEGDITDGGIGNVFIAYFEYATLAVNNTVKWRSSWAPCSDDPDLNKQVVIVVRRGHLDISGGGAIHGAAIVPEGNVEESGGVQFEGTIIANNFSNRGNSSFRLSSCAIRNLPGPWLDVTPTSWTEVDR
jgi:hypothetical protein